MGYATPRASRAAFRRTVGTSPTRYLSGGALFEVPDQRELEMAEDEPGPC